MEVGNNSSSNKMQDFCVCEEWGGGDIKWGLTHDCRTDTKGGLDHLLPKFEHIFVAVITFSPFFLCRYFYYQLVAYCVCFKMICETCL